jgi:hypothetical protein
MPMHSNGVADPDPVSGIRFVFYPLDPGSGSGMNFLRIPGPAPFCGQIFLHYCVFRILVRLSVKLMYSKNDVLLKPTRYSWNHKQQEKSMFSFATPFLDST